MRRNRKVIALIALLTLLICQFRVIASNNASVDGSEIKEKLNVLIGIEVLTEDNFGENELSKNITRAEYMGIIGEMFSLPDDTSEHVFEDVPNSMNYAGYINAAYKRGYIAGNGSGSFYPYDSVTHSQAIKILMYSMGYGICADIAKGVSGFSIVNMCPDLA